MAGYLVDTNVLSELRKPRPSPKVVAWLNGVPTDSLYLSVITIGEVAKGIARRRRAGPAAEPDADALQAWLETLLVDYGDRIIPVDVPIATRWGRLCDQHPQIPTDMLIAATALDRGLALATRNVAHFRDTGVEVVNPFAAR